MVSQPGKNGGSQSCPMNCPCGKHNRRIHAKSMEDVRGPLETALLRVRKAEFTDPASEECRRAGLALADTVESALMDTLGKIR